MATQKNFVVRNGLTVGATEVIDSSGDLTAAAFGTNADEHIEDVVGGLIVGGTNLTATYNDGAGTLTLDADLAGDIEGVTAGDGLTGGGTSGTATLNVGAGTGISVAADAVSVDMTAFDTGNLSEGSNLYHTTERVQDITGAQLVTNGSHTNITASYDDAGDGAIDLSIADATIQAKITGGTGVTVSSGEVSIGQAVATSDNVEFGNLTLSGDLTVNGTTTTIATTNTTAADTLFELGNGTTGSPANDSGIIIERGDSDNAFIGFDESADKFTVGTTSATGASTGDLTITTGTLVANLEGNVTGNLTGTASAVADDSVALGTKTTGNYVATIAGTSNEIEVSGSGSETAAVTIGLPDNVTIAGTSTLTGKATTGFTTIGSSDGALRNTFIHSSAPTSSDGAVGDMWIVYSE